jgi:GTP cyclohydrolase I
MFNVDINTNGASTNGVSTNGVSTNGVSTNEVNAQGTPAVDGVHHTAADLEPLVAHLITGLGEDISREGLLKTPARVEKALRDLTAGYHTDLHTVINDALFAAEGSDLVVVKDIEFYSLCEHHMLPFFGKAHIAYIPDQTILGLSKFARVLDVFARRLQVQERLTSQVADALMEVLSAQGVAVVTEASHMCMMMRGVQKQHSTTRSSAMRGIFASDRDLRQEFLDAIG